MQVETPACDDEVLLLESSGSMARPQRVWPYLCAFAIVAAAGAGGQAIWNSSNVNDVTSLHSYPWDSGWRSASHRFDANGCTWDGDDCRTSRCCARETSRCYSKSSQWASCNETCTHNVKWGAGADRRGRWVVTHHPVWDCTDLTISRSSTPTPVTAAPSTAAPATAAPTTAAPAQPSASDAQVNWVGDR